MDRTPRADKPPRRIFLGWDGPFLPRVCQWLYEAYGDGSGCCLSQVVVVVPGRRAGRNLLAELERAGKLLVAPEVLTLGSLPEALYRPRQPIAGPLDVLLAWREALQEAAPEVRQCLLPRSYDDGDPRGWVELGRELAGLHDELAGAGLRFLDVAARQEVSGEFPETDRWQALAALHCEYERRLESHGLRDLHAARLEGLAGAGSSSQREVVLVAMVELGAQFRQWLEPHSSHITALVHAPASEEAAFDDLGCLLVDKWLGRRLPLDLAQVHFAERPRHQGAEVVRAIRRNTPAVLRGAASRKGRGGGKVAVGIGDRRLTSSLMDALEQAGLPAHPSLGRSFRQTRPASLLDAFACYVGERRLRDLAALLRHPDVESLLRRRLAPGPLADLDGTAAIRQAVERADWLTVLDLYGSQTLMSRIGEEWPGDALGAQAVQLIHATLWALVPGVASRRPLSQWSSAILALLEAVYEDREEASPSPESRELHEALALLAAALDEQGELPPDRGPNLSAAQAIELTLARLAPEPLPAEASEASIELVGWLELALDEAPLVVVAGLNEGSIPERPPRDPFLPNRLRNALGLVDDQSRFARDLLILTTLLEGHREVVLIAGRRSLENEPLAPSRLLLSGRIEDLPEIVLRFYSTDESTGEEELDTVSSVLQFEERIRLFLPRPQPQEEPLRELSVTALRDYLLCPYRFYLRYVCKLRVLDDLPREMEGSAFGSLAHDVLRRFGRGEEAASTHSERIGRCLEEILQAACRSRFGRHPLAAARIQSEQLRRRLRAFAVWQAEQNRQGWRIQTVHVEQSLTAELDVDGEPVTLRGRIDRIDHHPDLGYRVLDYKTSDRPRSPQETHIRRASQGPRWIDLQLPLYHLLGRAAGITGRIELGFVQLPEDLLEVGYAPAPWSEPTLDQAVEEARRIVRQIRRGHYWPPGEPPSFDDGLGWISAGLRGEDPSATEGGVTGPLP